MIQHVATPPKHAPVALEPFIWIDIAHNYLPGKLGLREARRSRAEASVNNKLFEPNWHW